MTESMNAVTPTADAHVSVIPDDLLTPIEAARRLRVSKAALYERISRGDIPSYRFGRAIRLRATHLAQYLERSRSIPPARSPRYGGRS
jgi:excisionase family DNA binding protein